jgi:hypothetical protein
VFVTTDGWNSHRAGGAIAPIPMQWPQFYGRYRRPHIGRSYVI